MAPEARREPQLEQAIRGVLGRSTYSYAYDRVHLRDGTESETLVYLPAPDDCGSGGCTSLVFAQRGGNYQLVSSISLTRPPVIVSSHRTHGWKDLIVFVSGGGIEPGYYAVLRFDGKTYPENPTTAPATPLREQAQGVAYLAGADKLKFDIIASH